MGLDERLESLRAHRERCGLALPADSAFREIVPKLPQFHRLGRAFEDPRGVAQRGEIVLVRAHGDEERQRIGTDGCVFTSVGVAAFWDPPVVLAFGPMEGLRPSRLTMPWDSRGIGPIVGRERHPDVVREFSLEGEKGEDETYLVEHLATYFESPESFLEGDRPLHSDELGIFGRLRAVPPTQDTAFVTTPESRSTDDIVVRDNLLAVFADADYSDGNDEWMKTLAALRRVASRARADFVALPRRAGAIDYRQYAYRFVQRWLSERGVRL